MASVSEGARRITQNHIEEEAAKYCQAPKNGQTDQPGNKTVLRLKNYLVCIAYNDAVLTYIPHAIIACTMFKVGAMCIFCTSSTLHV